MLGLLKLAGALLLLSLLVAAGIYLANPLYWARVLTQPMADAYRAVDWFSPTEAVDGRERDVPVAGPEDLSISREALAAMAAYGSATDSVALIVYHRGAIQLEKYWPGFARGTRIETASMHKTVTGLLLGAAIADGRVGSVDDPVGKYLTEWSSDPRGAITLRQLLQNSTGLEADVFSPNPFGRAMKVLLGTDLVNLALTTPLAEPPGTRFQYINLNSQLLGLVIERATGKRYANYLSQRLWDRIGAPPALVWLDRPGGTARTFCCLMSNARGWLQVGRLLLGQGSIDGDQVLPARWIADTLTPAATSRNYGYLIWLGSPEGRERHYIDKSSAFALHSEPFRREDVAYLDGRGGQRLYVVPSADLLIVRLGRPQTDWDDAKLVNLALDGLATEPAHALAPGATGSGSGP